jgi:hypothetical protein
LICGRDSSQFGKPFFFLLRHSGHIATIDIYRSDVTPDLSSSFLTVTSPFPSHTPHVPAKPKTLSRQKPAVISYLTIIVLYFFNFLLLPLHFPDITTLLSSFWFFTIPSQLFFLFYFYIRFSSSSSFFSFFNSPLFSPLSPEVVSCRVALSYKLESSQHMQKTALLIQVCRHAHSVAIVHNLPCSTNLR